MVDTVTSALKFENLSVGELLTHAINNEEGKLASNGAFSAITGKRTGRSPKDRFIVDDAMTHGTVDWGQVNQPISAEKFHALWNKTSEYLSDKKVYVSKLRVGADPDYFLPVQVMTEYAWHSIFANHLFIRPEGDYAEGKPTWQIMSAPDFHTDPERDGVNSDGVVILNLSERKILICGIAYAGEMKKAMFSAMNYFMPDHDILPMHCAANMGEDGDVALFFGLSGTGKTTLSADPNRYLIGDDEHGWSKTGVFNFEGGCYAKCINLSAEREPVIYQAIRHGAIMENVVLNDKDQPDYDDDRYTQNSRAAYPREHLDKLVPDNRGGEPSAVVFLCCDLFGVLPPVAALTKEQAAYYFLSGYTALVGSTEMGSGAGVKTTFSRCFGAPFFPRPAQVYADLLMKRVEESGASVYLVNTGWSGGAYGAGGERFAIPVTRGVITAIVTGDIKHEPMVTLPGFNLSIPTQLMGVDEQLLDPRATWSDQAAYKIKANELIKAFQGNFKQYTGVDSAVHAAGPQVIAE